MQEATKYLRSWEERETPEITWESNGESMKLKINELLWMYLPPNVTLHQAEGIAMCIQDMIFHPEKYLQISK